MQYPNEACQTWQVWHADASEQRCPTCQHTWHVSPQEIGSWWYVVCPTCQQAALLARENTALMVAQETVRDLHQHGKKGRAYEECKERERKAEAAVGATDRL